MENNIYLKNYRINIIPLEFLINQNSLYIVKNIIYKLYKLTLITMGKKGISKHAKCDAVITQGINAGKICGEINKRCKNNAHEKIRIQKTQLNPDLAIVTSVITIPHIPLNSANLIPTNISISASNILSPTFTIMSNQTSDANKIKELENTIAHLLQLVPQQQQLKPILYFTYNLNFYKITQSQYNWDNNKMLDHISTIIINSTASTKFLWITDLYNISNKKSPFKFNSSHVSWDNSRKKNLT